MNQYKNNVTILMNFLRTEKFSDSVLSVHRVCYKELQLFLLANQLDYSYAQAMKWIDFNKSSWPYRKYTTYKHCVEQLEDVYKNGIISLGHMGPRTSAYASLKTGFKRELDKYLSHDSLNPLDSRHRIAFSKFLMYLQVYGLNSIHELDYEILLLFHVEDYHRSQKSKDIYEGFIRRFLKYLATQGKCTYGFSLALNKLIIPQIIKSDERSRKTAFLEDGHVITWSIIEVFLSEMRDLRYSASVMKYSKHILTLLFIFLDMHRTSLNENNLWVWYDRVKPLLGTNWQQARRSLSQFWCYVISGFITTRITGDPFAKDTLDLLPEWIVSQLRNYLVLLKREGLKPSSVSIEKSSNLRFCQYLLSIGVKRFSEITPKILQDFDKQDLHATPEAKVTYNSRIRGFLIYLYEQECISNPFLYRALPSSSAPTTRIVDVLSSKEVTQIWSINIGTLSQKAYRDYTIVCIGLTMGFRASDIVSIRFQDINWNERSISLTQVKTGKRICMPMPVKTGNILFRYLKDYRPSSTSPYIFIRHEVPYDKLHSGVCRRALNRFLPIRETTNKGFHIVRKTFATTLLRGQTKAELISDSLGHSTDATVYKYLALDGERMKKCPLSLRETGIALKGGVFDA
jgi:integrase